MKKWKRVIGLVCCTALTLSMLTGCGEKKNGEAVTDSEYGKKLKISITAGANDFKEDAYSDFLEEKFNVEFEYIPFTGEKGDKLRMWILSGDMPDITDAGSLKMFDYRTYARQDAFREIPDLSKYPNLKKYQDTMKGFNNFVVDGKLYAIPRDNDGAVTNYLNPCQFLYRTDWAKAVGLYHENNEYTWDEFIAMAHAFKDQDPGNLGDGKTIPIAVESWAFPMTLGLVQHNLYWEQYHKKDGRYVWGPGEEETLEGLKAVKDIYDQGIVWSDQILARSSDGQAKFVVGEAGITLNGYSVPSLEEVYKGFVAANPGVKPEDVIAPMWVKSPVNERLWMTQDLTYAGFLVLNPSLDDEKVERILAMMDWLASEEGYNFSTLGIEGVDWKMENGEPKIMWPQDEKGNYVWPHEDVVREPIDSIRWTNSFVMENPRFSQWSRETFKYMMERGQQDDVDLKEQDYELIAFSAPTFDKYGTYQKEVEDKMKELIASTKNVAELETAWRDYIASMQSKVQPILDEINGELAD